MKLVYGGNLGPGYVLSVFNMVGKNSFNYVVRSNNKINGFAVISGYGNNLRVLTIATTQRKGIGRLLMNRIRNDAKKAGYKYLKVNSIPESVGFYKKMGFEVVNTNSNTVGMKKNLAS